MNRIPVRAGDFVQIECNGQKVRAEIFFISTNGRSVMLKFDAVVDGHVDMMSILQGDDYVYRALMTGNPVKISAA